MPSSKPARRAHTGRSLRRFSRKSGGRRRPLERGPSAWAECPEGTNDNSPTLQRWVGFPIYLSPEGTAEWGVSYISSYFHCVFSTKERRPLICPALRDRLWPFMGGIARQHDIKPIVIGGMPDHVHLLLSLPSTLSIAKTLQLIKGGSSKWVHETFPEYWSFGWQIKYGALAVSVSLLDKTLAYIQNQEAHHRKMTFQEEFLALLRKHGITYDERYLWE